MSDLVAPTRKLLADGPLPLKVVAERLKQDGQLDEETLALAEEEGDDAGGYELEWQIESEDSIWMSGDQYDDDRLLAWGGQLLDGLVLTHRLTADEVAGDEVTWWPDLGILDWATRGRLKTSTGEPLTERVREAMPGDDASLYVGPKGWLADFTAGDLVAFRRRGDTVEVSAVRALGAGRAEIETLRTVAERLIQPGEVDELFPVMAEALVADGSAFREPVLPVVELMDQAGYEHQGSQWFRNTETPAQQAARWRRERATKDFELSSCCVEAYEEVMAALDDGPDPAGFERLGRALSHGWVAAAVVRDSLGATSREPAPDGVPALAALGRAVVDGSSGPVAGGRYLVAMEAAHRGDAALAEAELRKAHEEDPEHWPAAHELSVYEVDRGDLAAAAPLRHLGHPVKREWGGDPAHPGFEAQLGGAVPRGGTERSLPLRVGP